NGKAPAPGLSPSARHGLGQGWWAPARRAPWAREGTGPCGAAPLLACFFFVGPRNVASAAMRESEASIESIAQAVLAGDRSMLARAITLVESGKGEHVVLAQRLLERLLPATGKAQRIGITGVPGVGKSTVIDQLGINLLAQGHRVAV